MKRTILALRDRVCKCKCKCKRKRKACRRHGEIKVSRKEAIAEFEKQLRLIGREVTRSIDQRLKVKDLPAEARARMAQVLVERGRRGQTGAGAACKVQLPIRWTVP